MVDLSFWFMFPLGILIASIAMTTGIGGAIMFSPFFILVLKLDPLLAMASGLFIETFGFASGMIGHFAEGSVRLNIAKKLLVFTIPSTIFGVAIANAFPSYILKIILMALLFYLSYEFILKKENRVRLSSEKKENKEKKADITLQVKLLSSFGATLIGMISSGLGEINQYIFLKRMKLPVRCASGTSVFLVAVSASIGIMAHAYFFVIKGNTSLLKEVLPIILFTIPGVIIGGQIGPRIAKLISISLMSRFVGILFSILGAALLLTII